MDDAPEVKIHRWMCPFPVSRGRKPIVCIFPTFDEVNDRRYCFSLEAELLGFARCFVLSGKLVWESAEGVLGGGWGGVGCTTVVGP